MNKLSKKRALSNLLLLSALFAPGLVLAQDGGGAIVAAINQMDSNVSGRVDSVKNEVLKSNDFLKNISEKSDISNKEMVNALINYAAKSSINAYALDEQKYFQVAPGSVFAASAGKLASAIDPSKEALKVSTLSLINSLGMLSSAESINILGINIRLADKPPMGALRFYQAMKEFFQTGNTAALQNVNAAALLQATVLTNDEVNPTTKDKPSQTLVNVLTNPFPVQDDDLREKLKNGNNLTGAEMEKLGMVIAQYALVGVSANAWADIVARRTPPEDASGNPVDKGMTMMQIMEAQAKNRFTSADWYASIGASSDTALLREIAHMMAYNQWAQYQQFRLAEQQVSLLASINGVMAKLNTSMDLVAEELRKAQEEVKIQEKKAQEQAAKAKLEAEEAAQNAPNQ